MNGYTKQKFLVVLAILFFLTVISLVAMLNYNVNSERFPDSPKWTRFFR